MSEQLQRYATRSRRILNLLETPRYETKGLTSSERNDLLIQWVKNVEISTHSSETNKISNTILDSESNDTNKNYKTLKDGQENNPQNNKDNSSRATEIGKITSKVSTDLDTLASCESNDSHSEKIDKTTNDGRPENNQQNDSIVNKDYGSKSIETNLMSSKTDSDFESDGIDCESIKSISVYRESPSEYQPSSTSCVSETDLSSCKNSVQGFDDIIAKCDNIVYNINNNKRKNTQINEDTNKNVTKKGEKRSEHVKRYRQEEMTDSESEILVKCAKRNNATGKRIRDKGHCCYFCNKIMGKLARHFELMHKNETQVAKILIMPKCSRRRREAFGELIRTGDFYHNCQVLTLKHGELILIRRPSKKEESNLSYSSYGPCPDCLGFMMKKRLWHHIKYNCKSKITTTPRQQKRKLISESNALLLGIISPEYSTDYNDNILAKFNNDDISEVCRNDTTILKFGYLQFEKHENTQCELIRQTMRQLGRFVIRAKLMNDEIKDLTDCLIPTHFDLVLSATKSLCGSSSRNSKRPEFEIPSLALKLGHAFKKCIGIHRGMALRAGDMKKNEIYLCFLNLLEMEWSNKISSCALSTMYKRKFNHKQLLPFTEDLVVLTKYLDNEILKLKENLVRTNTDYKTWRSLASCTLTRIILFNKKRSGEASKLTIEQYATRPSIKDQGTQEFLLSLSPLEKQLASTMDVVDIEGKRGSRVPVLLTPDLKSTIDLLIKTRTNVGISNNNPYVFSPANSESGHLRGHDCLRAACEEPNLKHPNFITGTKLRKYIATVCQLFNLGKNEADWLARHLGHDIRVHRNFYRLHENVVETTKISRLLIAVEQGEANKYAGKSLEEINIEVPLASYRENKTSEPISRAGVSAIKRKALNTKSTEPSDNFPEKKKKAGGKTPWTPEEVQAVLEFFKFDLKKEILPGKEKCTTCILKYPVLLRRKWSDIKFYLKNYYARNGKMIGKK